MLLLQVVQRASQSKAWHIEAWGPWVSGCDDSWSLGVRGQLVAQRRLPTLSNRCDSFRAREHRLAKRGPSIKTSEAWVVPVAVIDGPYDSATLSRVLSHAPIDLGTGRCGLKANSACDHGTFVMGLIGARQDALIPGLCSQCHLLHYPLFVDEEAPSASLDELANAIRCAVAAGALIINLSVAIQGDESSIDPGLAAALDYANSNGAIVVVAAGNQGRLATGQMLVHPVTIPVAAIDGTGHMLPECNFGPILSRRGVSALGHQVLGYAPGFRTAFMTGTSVAAAVATGIIADVWSGRPDLGGHEMRMAIAQLSPRGSSSPPLLDRDTLSSARDEIFVLRSAMPVAAATGRASRVNLQGEVTMNVGRELPTLTNPTSASSSGRIATPASDSSACACGASSGVCTCVGNQERVSGFVYAIGTVEAECPNVAIEREMQALAQHLGVETAPDVDMPMRPTEDRNWLHAVLSRERRLTRYLARQLSWRLTIEDYPAFVLSPRDPADFDDLIDSLARPKFPTRDGGRPRRGAKAAPISRAPVARPQDLDVIIGVAGAQTPDGIAVKMDQIFTIRPEQLVLPGAGGHFEQLADNWGLTDEDRAYNYLIARYAVDAENLEEINEEFELTSVPVVSSRLGGDSRRIVRVIYTFKSRGPNTPAQRKYFVRVDVTDEFPFIATSWNRYLERGEQS
jgi:hypothetical protein